MGVPKKVLALPDVSCPSCWPLHLPDARRHRYTNSLGDLAATTDGSGTNQQPTPALFNGDILKSLEITNDIDPFKLVSRPFQVAIEFFAQHKRQETAEDMTADRLITLVEDRPSVEHRLNVPKYLLDLPEFLVLAGYLGSREAGHIGAQHPFAIKPAFRFDLLVIDRHAALVNHELTGVTAIADKALGVGLEPLRQRSNHSLTSGGNLSGLLVVVTDYIPPVIDEDLLDRQVRRITMAALREDIVVSTRAGEHCFTDFLDPSHPRSEDIRNAAVIAFEPCDSLAADHAPIGNDAKTLDVEAMAQAIDHRQQALHV